MEIEKCNGNWNFMYEFRIKDNWHPCHVIEVYCNKDVLNVLIFARNGAITHENRENVRKMSKERYLKERTEIIDYFGKWAFYHGYHEYVEDDLKMFDESNELSDDNIRKIFLVPDMRESSNVNMYCNYARMNPYEERCFVCERNDCKHKGEHTVIKLK